MHDSIVFSGKEADRLNVIVKEKIDAKLFLFAYYFPKAYVEDGELGFWKGATNIYGLFVDCAAFMKNGENNFLEVLKKKKVIDNDSVSKINDLMQLSAGIRSIFSHNNHPDYSKSNNNIHLLEKFATESLKKQVEIEDSRNITLSQDEWKQCTKCLVEKADECITLLENTLISISEHEEKSNIIIIWSELIIEWYKKKAPDLLFQVLNNKLALYSVLRQKKHVNRRLYIDSWMNEYKKKCIDSMDSFKNSTGCNELLPIKFFDDLIEETKPFEFWDKYIGTGK